MHPNATTTMSAPRGHDHYFAAMRSVLAALVITLGLAFTVVACSPKPAAEPAAPVLLVEEESSIVCERPAVDAGPITCRRP